MAQRRLEVVIAGDAKGLSKVFGQVERQSKSFGSSIGNAARGLVVFGGAAVAAGAIAGVALGKTAINAASDLNESISKVGVVFGKTTPIIEEWSKTSAEAMGLSQQQALEAAGTFGNLFTALGLSVQPAAAMSTKITGLASDLASFNNLDTAEVLEKLRSGLVGEVEPLRSLGVSFNAAQVEAKALELGLAKQGEEVSEAVKLQARYALILEQTKTAQGDFARTSDGAANKQRILDAKMKNLSATVGRLLLPAFTKVVAFLSDSVVPWLEENLPPAIEKGQRAFEAISAWVERNWPKIRDVIVQAVETVRRIVEEVTARVEWLWRNFGDNIMSFVNRVWPRIRQIIEGVLNTIRGIIKTITALIRGDWGQVWNGIKQTVTGVWTAIQGIVGGAIEAIRLHLGIVLEVIGTLFKAAWGKITDTVSGAIGDIIGFVTGLPRRFLELHLKLFEAAAGLGKAILEGIVSGLQGAVSFVADFAKALYNALADIINTHIIGGINDALDFTIEMPFPPHKKYHVSAPNIPPLPILAKGGIVTRPTLAMIGEAGREAVIPLDSPRARGMSGGGWTVNVNVAPGTNTREFERAVYDVIRNIDRERGGLQVAVR